MAHLPLQVIKWGCSWSLVSRIHGVLHLLAREELGTGTFNLKPRFDFPQSTSRLANANVSDAAQYVGIAQGIQGAFALSTIPGMFALLALGR